MYIVARQFHSFGCWVVCFRRVIRFGFTHALGKVAEVCMTVFDASSFKSIICVSPQRKRMFRLGYQVNCGQGACAAPASLKLNNNKT
jgi:hypothetical protein